MGIDKNEQRNRSYNKPPKGKKERPSRIPFNEMQICRIELTEKEKDELREFIANDDLEPDFDERLTDEGYSVKFSRDSKGNGKLCSVSYAETGHENSGYTLIGRGATNRKALAAVQYKIVYLVGDQPWSVAESNRGGTYDDLG